MAPAISREEHSSYRFAQSGGAPALREVSRDMEQNSEDSLGSKRSAEIHSGEGQRVRVSSARAKCGRRLFGRRLCDEASAAMQEHGFWKAELFCRISVTISF
ncbi:hypothetical protein D9754_00345 [Planomicrobium sp. Y74]|nr:hypothetical protein D9754_00345 [Planomicrobium sp. Y74]